MLLHIEGMACQHCRKHVEDALNALPGVTATVDLASATATVTAGGVTAEQLCKAVEDAGFTVTSAEA